jgi:hypothetical protein
VAAVAATISRTSPAGEPFQSADQRGQRRQPLAVIVDPGGGRGGGDGAAPACERLVALGREIDVDHRGIGMSLSSPPAPSQGSSSRWISSSGTRPDRDHAGQVRDRAGGGGGLGLAPGGIGLDDLDGDPAAHDRDHPRHRPGEPPLRQQAALGGGRTCHARLSRVGPLRRMAQRPGRIGDLAAVEPKHLGAGDARSEMEIVGGDDDRRAEPVERGRTDGAAAWPFPASTLPVGSSATSSSGRAMTARAMATRCCSPPDSVAGRALARSARPTQASISRTGPSRSSSLDAGDAQRQRDIVEGRQMADQPEILEDDADPPAEAGQRVARHGDDQSSPNSGSGRGRPLGEIEQFEQRGLAGARRAGEEIEAALPAEVEVAQHLAPVP